MKNSLLLCLILALFCSWPLMATDDIEEGTNPTSEVVSENDAEGSVETTQNLWSEVAPTLTCPSTQTTTFSWLEEDGKNGGAESCYFCCIYCDDVSSRIPCDEWCGCSCDDAYLP